MNNQNENMHDVAATCVDILQRQGLDARVGKRNGISYPALRQGDWTIALEWHAWFGRPCGAPDKMETPHWDWFVTPNLDLWQVEFCFGKVELESQDLRSPQKLAEWLMALAADPCQFDAFTTENYRCPSCELRWRRP